MLLGRKKLTVPLSFRFAESDDNKKDLPPLIFRGNETTTTTSSQATSIGPTQQKKRLIEEISAEQAAVHAASHSKNERLQCTTPVHSVAVKEPDSKHPKQRVFVKVTLPGVSSANQVDLEVSKVSAVVHLHCVSWYVVYAYTV